MTGRMEGRGTDAYWHGYLSEVLRGLLTGESGEEYAAAALAKYDQWLKARDPLHLRPGS